MPRRVFLVCALVVLALELLALGRGPAPATSTADMERMVAGNLRTQRQLVSDVRCVRPSYGEATCIALMYNGSRTRVAVRVDQQTGRVAAMAER